jgi:hypothetical protein
VLGGSLRRFDLADVDQTEGWTPSGRRGESTGSRPVDTLDSRTPSVIQNVMCLSANKSQSFTVQVHSICAFRTRVPSAEIMQGPRTKRNATTSRLNRSGISLVAIPRNKCPKGSTVGYLSKWSFQKRLTIARKKG